MADPAAKANKNNEPQYVFVFMQLPRSDSAAKRPSASGPVRVGDGHKQSYGSLAQGARQSHKWGIENPYIAPLLRILRPQHVYIHAHQTKKGAVAGAPPLLRTF